MAEFLLVIKYTLIFATVLAIVAIGGMFSERSGVINLGLEGIMVIGSVIGVIVSAVLTKANCPKVINFFVSILAAMGGGFAFSMLLAVACIQFKADQTITGTALNIMSTALAVIIARMYTKTPASMIAYDNEIFLFAKKYLSYFLIIAVLIIGISYIFLYKTKIGIRLMACGEHPQAADSVGVSVYKHRYLGVGLSGMLAGLGGFAYVIQSANTYKFEEGVVGFGFLALAVMIFGQWKPFKIALAALIFGLSQSIAFLYAGKSVIPSFLLKSLPYIICMVVLALTSKSSKAPKAEGKIYDKGQR